MFARHKQQDQQDQQQGCCHNGRYVQWFNLHGICRHTNFRYCGIVFYTVAAHQQAVGVDAVRCTGDQCAKVLPFLNFKFVQLIRQYNADLVDLIGQRFIQHMQHKAVTCFHLIQAGEQLGARKAAVTG